MTNTAKNSSRVRRAEPPQNWRDFPTLKPSEAEAVIGCSHAHLYKVIKSGHLNPIKIGASTHIPTEQIVALMATGATIKKPEKSAPKTSSS